MKTLFTFLLSSLVALSAFAADVAGSITVSFTGNRDFRVLIDGRSYDGSSRINLNNVRSGQHSIEVYPAQSNRGRRGEPVYSGSFTVRPQYDMHIKVLPNGRVQFNEKRSDRSNERDNRDWRNGDDRYGRDRNDRDDRYERQRDDRDRRDRDHRDWRNDDRNSGGYNDYNRAMSDADFNSFVQRVRSQWFGKMNTAREGISANYFTTAQVRQVLQLFNSENDRLELAKISYRRVVDPRSFTQLYDLFSTSGQADLDRYIRDNRY
jgi:hypothetical protein